jgi:hypothetical protein
MSLKKAQNKDQRKESIDLWIIALTTLVVIILFALTQESLMSYISANENPILSRLILVAMIEFGTAGLGIILVMIFRKESFPSHGLKVKGSLTSIVGALLCCVPTLVFRFAIGSLDTYLPFKQVMTTKEVLISPFPVNVIGMLITALAWGFFEGFNYIVLSDKLNTRFPAKHFWLNTGAIVSAVFCILIHGVVGVTFEGFIEMAVTMFLIYGMVMVRELTGNAWGAVFVFLFFWNAI